ncbi:MAG: protein kinase [Thermoanaerobaculia bacterium]|jgi:serine/threonine protein kinase
MTLAPGVRLGPYEIVAPLGAGGMGEVWRGKDTRLGREVAIKILPAGFAQNEQFRARFEREAKTISSLNHPNICTLFDVGHAVIPSERSESRDLLTADSSPASRARNDGIAEGETTLHYLVMELIEGESLADRLAKGPLPADQVIRYGAQVADALARAHSQGIIHRDLKPGNVMLTKTGAKLLDFGLARSGAEGAVVQGLTEMPTQAKPLTQEGTILGTFQYMAPEQLEGAEADPRTDIFALGALLYEMATGKRAFEGSSRTSLIAAIVTSHPTPISQVTPMTPPALDHVVKKCLEKDPDDRWQSARDVASELRWISEAGSQAGVAAPITIRRKNRERIAWTAAAVGFTLAAGLLVLALRERSKPPLVIQSSIVAPEKSSFRLTQTNAASLTISPDGKLITFLARCEDGKDRLWIRPVDSEKAAPLTGTEDAANVFWSPDSHFIAFFAGGFLQKIDVRGGPPLNLCEIGLNPRRGSWNRDDVIIFSPTSLGPVHRISAAGGASTPVTKLDAAKSETTHRWSTFLPDGRHFIFMAGTHVSSTRSQANAIYVGDLQGGPPELVLQARSNVEYADGRVLYVRDNVLVSQTFDAKRRKPVGDPVPVAENVQYESSFFQGVFSVSQTGMLVYRQGGGDAQDIKLEWVDRAGKVLESIGRPGAYGEPALSPDGKRLAIEIEDRAAGSTDVWVVDLARGIPSRLTFGPGNERFPVWSPDGKQIAFSQLNKGILDVYVKQSSGEGAEQLIATSDVHKFPSDWSSDGRVLVLSTFDPKVRLGQDIFSVSMTGERKLQPQLSTQFNENRASFSRDGHWFLYTSNESGRDQVYVAPYPGPGGKWQVSTEGADSAEWGAGDREIIYQAADGALMAVDVKLGAGAVETSSPRLLFNDPRVAFWRFDRNSGRFLVGKAPEDVQSTPITLVSNWTAKLAR